MSALYFAIEEQIKCCEKWLYNLIGKNEMLSALTSYLLINNIAKNSHSNEIKKIMSELNDITDIFNNYFN